MSDAIPDCTRCKHFEPEPGHLPEDFCWCACPRPSCEPQGKIRLTMISWAEFCECYDEGRKP